MTTNFTDVGSFHCKFNLDHVSCDKDPWDCKSLPGPRIDDPDHELIAFRLKFMLEELKETAEALGFALQFTQDQEGFRFEFVRNVGMIQIDHEHAFDGLLDLAYVTFGTAHVLGYPWQDGWEAVQRANMAKERALRAEQSARGSTYDVVKPAGWMPPDIASVLRRHGFKV